MILEERSEKGSQGGYIPAIIYGGGMENLELMVSVSDIRKLSSHGEKHID